LNTLAEAGALDRDAVTVAYITGTGLKTQEAVANHLREVKVIQPNLEAFEASQLQPV
jgi:threonine synthase